jgi:hypothetical protein
MKPKGSFFMRALMATSFFLFFAACGHAHDHDHNAHDHGSVEDGHEEHDHGNTVPDVPVVEDEGQIEADVPPPVPRTSLVDMFAWSIVASENDPWGSSAPADGICDEEAIKGETTPDGDWFDVNTSFCDYVTVVQPLTVDVAVNTELHIGIYHFVLESAEGPFQFGVAIGDPAEVVWETTYDPDGETGTIEESWNAARAYTKGEAIYYHLSNHGSNNWSLTELTKSAPE